MKRLLLLLLFPLCAPAQSFEWADFPQVNMPYNPDMVGYCVAVDAGQNLYAAGFLSVPYIYNDITGNQFVRKYDSGGQLLFSKEIQGHVQTRALATNSQNQIIGLFSFINTITIGEVTINTVNQGEQQLIACFDTDGDLLWHEWLQPAPVDDGWYNEIGWLRALSIDSEDRILIGFNDFFKSYIRQYDAQGTVIAEVSQTGARLISSVGSDAQGNWFAAGSCLELNNDFNGTPITTDLPYSTYLVKYDAAHQMDWIKIYPDITCSAPQLVVTAAGAVFLANQVYMGTEIEGQVLGESMSSSDFYLLKYDAAGNFQWARETPGSGGFLPGGRSWLSPDTNGGVLLSGRFQWATDWGNGIVLGTGENSMGACLLRYDAQGTVTGGIDLSQGWYSRFDSAISGPYGQLYAAGMAMEILTLGATTHTPPDSDYYPFITRIQLQTLGMETPAVPNLVLYPNPADDLLHVSGLAADTRAKVRNALGRTVMETIVSSGRPLDVSSLSSGLYLLELNETTTLRFLRK